MINVKELLHSKKTVNKMIKIFLMAVTLALVALLSYMFGTHMIHAPLTEDAMGTRPLRELESMRITVFVLGLLMVGTLAYSRVYLSWQNKKMFGYTRLMLDKTPLGCSLWDEDLNILECNQELSRLFGLTDKSEFPALFHLLSPKHQPGGAESRVKARDVLVKAFSEGYCRTEWEHVSLTGEIIPCDIIFQRVEDKRGYVVVAYVRDMREQKAMIEKIREADEQERILLDSAPLNCSLWDKDHNIIYSDKETVNLFGLPAEK